MKYFRISILLFGVIFFAKNLQAQYPTKGSYITNNTMTPFHGTWRWISAGDTVTIYFNTQKINHGDLYDKDNLLGWYQYKKANIVVVNTFPIIGTHNESIILGSNDRPNNLNKVEATFKDVPKNNYCDVTLTLNAAQNQITWNMKRTPGSNIRTNPNTPATLPGFTLPVNMVLVKQ